MKKLILAIALTAVSPSVMAEWTLIAVNSDYGLNVYVDYATIRRNGDKVKMWRLYDYKTVQTGIRREWLSDITQQEFDCQNESSKILATSWYSRNMGNGEVENVKKERPAKRYASPAPFASCRGSIVRRLRAPRY